MFGADIIYGFNMEYVQYDHFGRLQKSITEKYYYSSLTRTANVNLSIIRCFLLVMLNFSSRSYARRRRMLMRRRPLCLRHSCVTRGVAKRYNS